MDRVTEERINFSEPEAVRISEEYYVPREVQQTRRSLSYRSLFSRRLLWILGAALILILLIPLTVRSVRRRGEMQASKVDDAMMARLMAGMPMLPTRDFHKTEGDFMNVYYGTGRFSGIVQFQIPKQSLDKPFVISATWYKGNGESFLLNMPVDGSDSGPAAFSFRIPASNPATVELYAPQFYIDLENEESPMKAAFDAGTFTGWLGQMPFLATSQSLIINVTPWILSGMTVVHGLTDPHASKRIVSASAFSQSIRVELDLHYSMQMPDGAMSASGGIAFTVAALPDVPMRARAADERIGYFVTSHLRLDADRAIHSRVDLAQRRNFQRHNGEILYVVDTTVPERWRQSIKEGVEEWNKAFAVVHKTPGASSSSASRKGSASTMKVRALLPGDSDFPHSFRVGDATYNSISWSPSLYQNFALGPSNVDPRSGEILYSHIVITHQWVHLLLQNHRLHGQSSSVRTLQSLVRAAAGGSSGRKSGAKDITDEGDRFVMQALKSVVMHEVGHTLGLRHNFRGSANYPLSKLSDPAFVKEKGLTSSVMDYLPPVFRKSKGDQVAYYTPTIGEYDYVAIKYGYAPEKSSAELDAIASWAVDHGLHFATDEDVATNMTDPYVSAWDLGSEPLDYHEEMIEVCKSMIPNLKTQATSGDFPWFDYTSDVITALGMGVRPLTLMTRYLGGFVVTRSRASESSPKANEVVDPKLAERALNILVREMDPVNGLLGSKTISSLEDALVVKVGRNCDLLHTCGGQGPLDVLGEVRMMRSSILEAILNPGRLAACDAAHSRSSGSSPSATAVLSRLSSVFVGDAVGSDAFASDAATHWLAILDEFANMDEKNISPAMRAAFTAELASIYRSTSAKYAKSSSGDDNKQSEESAVLWALAWRTKDFALMDSDGKPL